MPRKDDDEDRQTELGARAANSEYVENKPWMGKTKIARDTRDAKRNAEKKGK